jgi:PhnB protein
MNVSPYLSFEGRCDEAIAFYKTAVGAEVTSLMRFKEMPGGCPEGGPSAQHADKVMHSELKIGDSLILASDGRVTGKPQFAGISLTIDANSDAQAQKLFTALSAGGNVTMPIAETFFASQFGMVSDKFGVAWVVIKRK